MNFTDPFGLFDAATMNEAGQQLSHTPLAPLALVGVAILAVAAIDIATDGAISNAVNNLIDITKDAISSIVNEKKQERDKERNPLPPGNTPGGGGVKNANGGPQDMGNPGDLGGNDFKPPNNPTVIGVIIIAAAGVTSIVSDLPTKPEGPEVPTIVTMSDGAKDSNSSNPSLKGK